MDMQYFLAHPKIEIFFVKKEDETLLI
jgi:hypothetical protein